MALCWPSLLVLIFTFIISVDATNFSLTNELTNFIPSCAQECFISFLDANFQSSGCSSSPSLDCLCSHNTTTGYTIGEGAVQCILGEASTGLCKGNDASQTVIVEAFQMCNGEADALPNTHGTITATLILESASPSIVLIAPATATMPSGMTTLTTTPTATAVPSGTASITASATSVPNSASNTTIPAVAGVQTTKLTENQIIGIGAGIAGAGLICVCAIMAILLLQKRRTRRILAARESDMIPFQMSPRIGGMGGNAGSDAVTAPFNRSISLAEKGAPMGERRIKKAETPPPVPAIPPRLEISSPNMFARRSIEQENIGVAVSPGPTVASERTPQRTPRRSSRLLPEKPSLKLQMPPPKKKTEPQGLSLGQKPISAISRQSTTTQFEIDEDSADTAVNSDNAWGRGSTERILNPAKNWEAEFPTDPEPPAAAIAVMRPDEFHWRPPSTSPTSAATSGINRSFSLPRRPDEYARSQQGKQTSQPPVSDESRVPSSVYSARGSAAGSDGGRNSAPRGINYGQYGPYDLQRSGSFKASDSATLREEDTRYAELSPVVESPASGKSPVSYPKIPKRLSSAEMMKPPPPQPDFAKAFGAGGIKPWPQGEMVSQRDLEGHAYDQPQETPSQIQIGMLSPRQGLGHQQVTSSNGNTPNTRTYSFPAPPPERLQDSRLPQQPPQALLPGPRNAKSPPPQAINFGPRNLRSPPPRPPVTPPPGPLSARKPLTDATGFSGSGSLIPLSLSTSPHPPNFKPLQRSISGISRPGINPLSAHPSISLNRSPSLLSQSSKLSAQSNGSSLLAKRRGEKQAKELTLANEEDQKRQQAKWRVLKREEIEMAKKEGWRPRLGSPAAEQFLRGEGSTTTTSDAIKETVREFAFERTELPRTPGWIPKLTPTRKGDDLFLNVQ